MSGALRVLVGALVACANGDTVSWLVPCAGAAVYTVVAGDTCKSIAVAHQTNVADIETPDGGPCPANLKLNSTLLICPSHHCADGKIYSVVSGDSCAAIAAKFKTDVAHVTTVAGEPCPTDLAVGETVICSSHELANSRP
jgi:hypothetical protein